MRFQLNNLSYRLGLLGFLIYIVYVAVTMDYIPKQITLGLEVMINLVFFMILFFSLEKVKNYSIKWSIYSIILGSFTLLRILWHPFVLNDLKLKELALISGMSLAIAGILIIVSGIIGYRKSSMLLNYLNKTGLNMIKFGYNPDGTKKERE